MAPSPPLASQAIDTTPPAITSTPPPDVLQPLDEAPPPQPPPRSSTSPRTLRIGTRASTLAIAQVDIFTAILKTLHPCLPTKTVPISVAGDRDKTTDLHTLAQTGKSLWTEELEVLLLKGEIDCIVHSLKDVPTKVVEGCEVKIVGERGERRDCVVFPKRNTTTDSTSSTAGDQSTIQQKNDGDNNQTTANADGEGDATSEPSPTKNRKIAPSSSSSSSPSLQNPQTLSSLPPNSLIGTSSIRRSAMIRRRYPHLLIRDVRGNVGTRLRKLDDPANGFSCIILAAAGLQRIGFGERISEWLDPGSSHEEGGEGGEEEEEDKGAMFHAVGQGAIGLEIREGDEWMQGLLEGRDGKRGVVVNRVSWECQAERSLLRTLEGGCSVPVGVSCSWGKHHTTEDSAAAGDRRSTTTGDPTDGQPTTASLLPPTAPDDLPMSPGILHIRASVTSVDGTQCVAATHKQWVSNDAEADEAGWQVASVLEQRGAGKILEGITLNRGMVERGGGA
ncbi:MAG: hypothetical protein Q9169_001005 [Polycauliona sp. 2 TL-2023]